MSNTSRTKTTRRKWKFFKKHERNASKKRATAGSLLSQSYPAAHGVFEGACQIAKWQNNGKIRENRSPLEKRDRIYPRSNFNGRNKTIQNKLSQHPNRNISHPWIIRSVGNHVPHDTCEVPGFLPQQEPFGPARWPQLSMFVRVSFMFLRNVRSIPSYSNIFNIFLPSSVFWVLQCKMWKCV